jgi:MazG family protein
VLRNWEAIKAEEKRAAGKQSGQSENASILDGVSTKAPALMEAHQISTKVARVGFDWKDVDEIFGKLHEELDELREAISAHQSTNDEADHTRVREEIGDLLFVITNIARRLNLEPEAALKLSNRKFRRRFAYIEQRLREQHRNFDETTLSDLEELWQEAKRNL